ncbi:MAG: LysM peptidoglycan-binding domain-containing protein [Candidatus Saccharimonadales bacterium]
MKTKTMRVILGVICGFLVGTAAMPAVSAQSLSVGGTPAYPKSDNPRTANIFIEKLKPGETVKDGIRIVNSTKDTRTINLGAVDSVMAVDGSFSCRQNNEKKTGVGKWVVLSNQQITLAPATEEVVDFTITTPKDAGPGEHGGCVTFQDTKSYAKTSGSGIQLGFRGAVRIAVTVPGVIRKELHIVRIDATRNQDGSYMVSPVAKNSGNVSLDVQARAQIFSMFGQKSRILDDAKYPIMPGATTGWPYRFERPFWGGFYKARVSLSYNANIVDGIGENIGSQKRIRAESKRFFIIPDLRAIAIEVGVILLPLILLFWLWRKKHRAKRLAKKWEAYVVKTGDTLVDLAESRNAKWKKIARLNAIKPPYLLKAGQTVLLPRRSGRKNSWDVPVDGEVSAPPAQPESVFPQPARSSSLDRRVNSMSTPEKTASTSHFVPPAVKPITPVRRKKSSTYNWAAPSSAWSPQVQYAENATAVRPRRKKASAKRQPSTSSSTKNKPTTKPKPSSKQQGT